MTFIILWRPPKGFIDKETNEPYEENELHIIVAKAKPKGSAKLGKCKLFWDWRKNRYYEVIDGQHYYGLEWKAKEERGREPGNLNKSILNNTFGKDFEQPPF